jgi:hypothetical protein
LAEDRAKRRPEQDDEGVTMLRAPKATTVVLVALVLEVLVIGVLLRQFWGGTVFGYEYSCSRSGQRALQSATGFVRAHPVDSSGFEVQTYDCDSAASAFLQFDTPMTPAAARDVLLADGKCRLSPSSSAGEPPLDDVVQCDADGNTVHLTLESRPSGSQGELSLA